jgi:hypothetical protein
MAQPIQPYAITAPGFMGLNTQDSSLDLSSGYALIANNCVIDQYGRIGARKGWTKVNSSSGTLGDNPVKAIGELITRDGTSYTICAGNNKIFKLVGSTLTELTYGGGGTAPTITDSNWQFAMLLNVFVMFQSGHDPLYFDPTVSTTTYKRISEAATYTGTVQKSNTVIAAYGRFWHADTTTDKLTIQWCDVNSPFNYSTGTSGTLDTYLVWPKGGDTITALAAHNNSLFIFGKKNILVYTGANNPATMTLSDTIVGIGCIARDTIATTGTDLIFLSDTGVRSIMRTIQEKSSPINDLSKNVRNDLISAVNAQIPSTIKAVYSPADSFYIVTIPTLATVYCFDTKGTLQDNSFRATTWDSIDPRSFCFRSDGVLLMGKIGYVGQYTGYNDDTATYRLQYFTNHSDLGDPSVTSILKKLSAVIIGGTAQIVTFKWGYDFRGDFQSATVNIPSQGVAYYGLAEYGSTYSYSNGVALQTLSVYPNGAGKIVQTGYETNINGTALSIQKIEIFAKHGKLI